MTIFDAYVGQRHQDYSENDQLHLADPPLSQYIGNIIYAVLIWLSRKYWHTNNGDCQQILKSPTDSEAEQRLAEKFNPDVK